MEELIKNIEECEYECLAGNLKQKYQIFQKFLISYLVIVKAHTILTISK